MPEVLVRNLDETIVEQLRDRARGNGRSWQAELKLILEQAAAAGRPRPTRVEYRVLANRVRAALGDCPQADSSSLLAEDRAR